MARGARAFSVLLLLARLYPSPVEGADSQYPLRAFLPSLERAAASPVLQARKLAARAICSLVPYSGYPEATLALLDSIERDGTQRQNQLHGRLLQVQHMLRHCVLETSMYTAPDLLRWRPVADRALLLASLLGPQNPCAVTAAAAADALAAAVRLGTLLSAPPPPPAVIAAASELLTRPSAGLYGTETARVAAVGLLWTLGAERSVDVAQLDGYDALQRHLQLLKEKLILEAGGGEPTTPPSRLSPVARPAPVPDLGVQPERPPQPQETAGPSGAGEDEWLEETAAALLRRLADTSRPLPAPCLQTVLAVLAKMNGAAAIWDNTVLQVVRRLAAVTAAADAEQKPRRDELDTKVEPEVVMEKDRVTVTVEETVSEAVTAELNNTQGTMEAQETGSNDPSAAKDTDLGPPTPEVSALCRAAASHEHVRADMVRLAAGVLDRLSPQILDESVVPAGSAVLDDWCRLVQRCCSVDGTVTLRQAACHATASALLWPTRQLSVGQEMTLWRCLMTLLADDEADVRDAAAEVVDALDTDDHDQDSWEEEIDSILHRAVAVFCARMAPRDLKLTVLTLLHWIFTDDDGGQLGRAQEDEERVFDKGEMNIFSEDVLLARAATGALLSLVPELPEQPLLLSVRQLEPLPLVRQLPADYQLELSDLLRQAARQAESALRRLTPGPQGVAQRGRALLCLRAFRRLRLTAGLREFYMEPEVDELWQKSVVLAQSELCFRPLWREVLDS
ncbi:uncharacterized protein LOC122370321 [Amphibalanus amphitrite]|uniref:uncharacterized protein LOC122370321 n=1 Tax=Amphibalanus amphitrite TaxID=1232801 RepID=UPI001C8FD7A4|nr:uncharacterized protein LOC122370321 [Amphibalanus amphitrite]